MKKYIVATTFSPLMLDSGIEARIVPMTEAQFESALGAWDIVGLPWESAVGHQNTAVMLSRRVGIDVPFNRANVVLDDGDQLLVATPKFRAPEGAREFTDEEIAASEWRFFMVFVKK